MRSTQGQLDELFRVAKTHKVAIENQQEDIKWCTLIALVAFLTAALDVVLSLFRG